MNDHRCQSRVAARVSFVVPIGAEITEWPALETVHPGLSRFSGGYQRKTIRRAVREIKRLSG